MKKTFALNSPGKDRRRVIETVKNDVRRYLKRERRKPLPEGVDFHDFDCKVGADKLACETKHPAEVIPAIDLIAAGEAAEVYVEILAKPGYRTKKAAAKNGATDTEFDGSGSSDSSETGIG